MNKFNNFPLYFPGCLYRTIKGHSKTCHDLDQVLAELNFDMNKFNEINERIRHQIDRTVKLYYKSKKSLTPEEEKEIEQLMTENKKDTQLFEELIEPAYIAMRNRGYSHKELWT